MSILYTLSATTTARQEVKKSRFLATAGVAESEETAKAFLAQHSDPTAHHNCWAWRIGQNYRFNDDGEPGGTAGKPILRAIEGQALDRVVLLVTRWFGGALLGSGGLVRAYGGTAALCLQNAEKTPLIETRPAMLTCPFSDLALLQARLNTWPGVQMEPPTFSATGASWSLAVPLSDADQLARLVNDLTRGQAQLQFEE
ncbi:IMPACT family protein [Xanthobacter sp. TB0139]|uniref:IMPACT family protein n=1 Tax=Xanthobacter sp. TB0139 TaxID=3459178 RepID=UPI00403A7119